MLVTCPHCGFLTAPTAPGDGDEPRCPRCGGLLDGPRETAAENAMDGDDANVAQPSTDAAATGSDARAPDPDAAVASAAPAATDAGVAPQAESPPAPATEAATPTAAIATPAPATKRASAPRGRAAPSFVRGDAPVPAARRTQRREWIALGVLAALLPLQLLLAQRDELATQARWRPLLTGVCAVLRCDLPEWREPAAFALLDRSVQPKPGAAGVLKVSASFRNDARWAQPWPTLRLSLSDIDGREAGARAFAPAEYRRGHAAADVLAPGQSALVEFDVIEPAPNIVAFSFEFE